MQFTVRRTSIRRSSFKLNTIKKVGFIDYYLDEWHANNYPKMLKEASGGEFEVCYAYGKIDSPIGGLTNAAWAKKYGITLLNTIEEVIEKSDVLIVLSPDNPEMHEELCDLPLKSGKLVYVDKTFAPTRAAAERIFANADKHGTKCYSSSALGFSSELDGIDIGEIDSVYSEGPGVFEVYIIHQLEPLARLINADAKRVMYTGTKEHPAATIEFEDGRLCHLVMRNDESWSFKYTVIRKDNSAVCTEVKSDYFGLFIKGMVEFFRTGKVPVPHSQTITVIGVREALIKAQSSPFEWINVG